MVRRVVELGISAACGALAFKVSLDALGGFRHRSERTMLVTDLTEDEIEPDLEDDED